MNPACSCLSSTYIALCLKVSKVWISLNLVLPKHNLMQVLQSRQFKQEDMHKEGRETS